jgi:hypothetical protein
LSDIVDDFDVGYHAVVPDFCNFEYDNGDGDLGLGIYRFRTIPCKVILHDVESKAYELR